MAVLGPLRPAVAGVGTAAWLSWRSAAGMSRRVWRADPLVARNLADALLRFVWEPVPVLMVLAALIGVIGGILGSEILAVYRAERLVIGTLVEAMLRHVLPLVVGIFASGSVSVELASRLEAMSLAREIDAIESMGHDPVAFTLGPPFVAVIAAAPLHMLMASLAALAAGALPIHLSANVPWRVIGELAYSPDTTAALLTGAIKSLVFAWIAFAVGATVGRRAILLPADIGRRAGRAFTTGMISIFAAAALWVALS